MSDDAGGDEDETKANTTTGAQPDKAAERSASASCVRGVARVRAFVLPRWRLSGRRSYVNAWLPSLGLTHKYFEGVGSTDVYGIARELSLCDTLVCANSSGKIWYQTKFGQSVV
jgi:hypothetical protein